jgi:transcriptional regulator with XRE-family HTH domain
MNPETIKATQSRLGLSELSMAAYLGVPVHTYRKWVNGTRTLDSAPRRLLEVLERLEHEAPDLHLSLIDAAQGQDKPASASKSRGKGKVAPVAEKPASDPPAAPYPGSEAWAAVPDWMKRDLQPL